MNGQGGNTQQSPHQPGRQQHKGSPHKKPKLGPEPFKRKDTTLMVPRKLKPTAMQNEKHMYLIQPSTTMTPCHGQTKQLASHCTSTTKPCTGERYSNSPGSMAKLTPAATNSSKLDACKRTTSPNLQSKQEACHRHFKTIAHSLHVGWPSTHPKFGPD